MIKFYNNKKKRYYENKIKEHVKFNISKINEHKKASAEETEYSPVIAQSYDLKYLEELKSKYNIDDELINEVQRTYDLAIKEYNEFVSRREHYKKNKVNREKVNYYKQAIMELKAEGLI